MRFQRLCLLALVTSMAACGGETTSSSGAGGSGGDPGTGSGGSCSCTITENGVSETLQCGEEGCVNGTSFKCSASADISVGGDACDSGSGGAGSSSSSTNGTGGAPPEKRDFGESCESHDDCKSEFCASDDVFTEKLCTDACAPNVECPDSEWCCYDPNNAGAGLCRPIMWGDC